MSLEEKVNKRLIKFVIWSPTVSGKEEKKTEKEIAVQRVDKIKNFFDSGIQELKKEVGKIEKTLRK